MLDKFDLQLGLMGLNRPRYSEDDFHKTGIPCPYCESGSDGKGAKMMLFYGYGNWQCKSCGRTTNTKELRAKINSDIQTIDSKKGV